MWTTCHLYIVFPWVHRVDNCRLKVCSLIPVSLILYLFPLIFIAYYCKILYFCEAEFLRIHDFSYLIWTYLCIEELLWPFEVANDAPDPPWPTPSWICAKIKCSWKFGVLHSRPVFNNFLYTWAPMFPHLLFSQIGGSPWLAGMHRRQSCMIYLVKYIDKEKSSSFYCLALDTHTWKKKWVTLYLCVGH